MAGVADTNKEVMAEIKRGMDEVEVSGAAQNEVETGKVVDRVIAQHRKLAGEIIIRVLD